jgi:hypothetical protein
MIKQLIRSRNQEHVELVRQLVMSKIEKEETENELVRYKMLCVDRNQAVMRGSKLTSSYAELAHAQQDAMSTHSRFSAGSSMSQMHGLSG